MLAELAAGMVVTAIILELLLVWRYRWLLSLLSKNTLASLAFSMFLSLLVSEVFGASGTVVLLAAVSSTIVMTVVYRTGALLVVEPLVTRLLR